MRLSAAGITVLAALLLAPAGAAAGETGPKAGFRAHRWGDAPPKEARKQSEQKGGPPGDWYSIPYEKLSVGDAKLEVLEFGYFQGRLYSVRMAARGPGNRSLLLDGLTAVWGKGETKISATKDLSWTSSDPLLGRTVAFYSDDPLNGIAVVTIYSERIREEAEAARRAKAKAAAADL
jgi:hypothetical protein